MKLDSSVTHIILYSASDHKRFNQLQNIQNASTPPLVRIKHYSSFLKEACIIFVSLHQVVQNLVLLSYHIFR